MTKTDAPDKRLFRHTFSSKDTKKYFFSIFIIGRGLMERIMHLVPVASQPSQSSAAISGFHPIFAFSPFSPARQRLCFAWYGVYKYTSKPKTDKNSHNVVIKRIVLGKKQTKKKQYDPIHQAHFSRLQCTWLFSTPSSKPGESTSVWRK